jgi:hypothetical protein
MVVAAPDTTVDGQPNEGAVYVYTKPKSGWANATQRAVLTLPVVPFSPRSGAAVAVSGNTIVVGAPFESVGGTYQQGVAYVFSKPKSGWASTSDPTATLSASDGSTESFFGTSVAVSGGTIVVGEVGQGPHSAAYVFAKPRGDWVSSTQTAKLTGSLNTSSDGFGHSVAISGGTAVVGAPDQPKGAADDTGMGYVFVKPTGGWTDATETRRLVASHPIQGAAFGSDLAMSGGTVVVGAPGDVLDDPVTTAGSIDVFTRPRAGWGQPSQAPLMQTAALTARGGSKSDGFGTSVAVSGGRIAAGLPTYSATKSAGRGVLDLYDQPVKGWRNMAQSGQLTASNGKAGDEFGAAVALTGSTVDVGAPDAGPQSGSDPAAGAAYVFSLAMPQLGKLKQSHSAWVVGTRKPAVNPKHVPKGGTRFGFRLNEPATVTLVFAKKRGSHFGSAHPLTVAGRQGSNRVYVDGPLSGKARLAAGRYRVEVRATNAAGETTAVKTLHFRTRRH